MTIDAPAAQTPVFALTTSRGFASWLAMVGGSIVFTTYQGAKVFFLGVKPDGILSAFERSFPRCMGVAIAPDCRAPTLTTEVQLYRFDNILPAGKVEDEVDALFAPHQIWTTGDLDIDDVGMDAQGQEHAGGAIGVTGFSRWKCLVTKMVA